MDRKGQPVAVLLVDAVGALPPARRFEHRTGLDRIVLELFNGGIVVGAGLEGRVGGPALAEQDAVDDRLPVDRVTERVGQLAVFGEERMAEVIEDPPVVGGLHVVDGEALRVPERPRVLRGHLREVELPRPKLHGARLLVGHDLEDDPADLRRARVVIGVALEHDALARVP